MSLKRDLIITASIFLLIVIAGCGQNIAYYKQASKEYNRGEYEPALASGVQSLRLKKDNAKAQALVEKTYDKVVAVREARIRQLEASSDEDKWDRLVEEYAALLKFQGMVQPLSPLVHPKTKEEYSFPMQDYETPHVQSKLQAAEVHYARGEALAASSDNPDVQREAYNEYVLAQTFIQEYKDSALRAALVKKAAVKRLAILAFEDKSGSNLRYGSLIDLLTQTIIGKLVSRDDLEFLSIITRDQMDALINEQQFGSTATTDATRATAFGTLLNAHEIMTGKIIQINYIPPRTTSVELSETKEMVTGKETYTTKKGKQKTRDVKEDVTCVYKKYTKTATVKIISSFSVMEVLTGKIKLQDTVSSEYTWTDVWGRVENGDIRVLSNEALALVAKQEPYPPSETDMVNLTLEGVGEEIAARVAKYVK